MLPAKIKTLPSARLIAYLIQLAESPRLLAHIFWGQSKKIKTSKVEKM